MRSVQWVSVVESMVEKTWGSLERKREGVIDGEGGGDDSVDTTCVGWWEGVKDLDVDKAHGKNDKVYFKCGMLHVEKQFVILRDD